MRRIVLSLFEIGLFQNSHWRLRRAMEARWKDGRATSMKSMARLAEVQSTISILG